MERFTSFDMIDIMIDFIKPKTAPIQSVETDEDLPEAVISLNNGQVFIIRAIQVR